MSESPKGNLSVVILLAALMLATTIYVTGNHQQASPRYVLHVGRHEESEKKGVLLFKIDSLTGQTWIYDTEEHILADRNFLKKMHPEMTDEEIHNFATKYSGMIA